MAHRRSLRNATHARRSNCLCSTPTATHQDCVNIALHSIRKKIDFSDFFQSVRMVAKKCNAQRISSPFRYFLQHSLNAASTFAFGTFVPASSNDSASGSNSLRPSNSGNSPPPRPKSTLATCWSLLSCLAFRSSQYACICQPIELPRKKSKRPNLSCGDCQLIDSLHWREFRVDFVKRLLGRFADKGVGVVTQCRDCR